MPHKVLQVGATVICKPLAAIIKKCLSTSSFPDELKFAKVTVFLKRTMQWIKETIP